MWNAESRFNAMVQAYSADLFRYAYWLCLDRDTAEDLVQETFLRAWKSLDGLKDEDSAKAWLITTLRRENARRFERKRLELADVDMETVPDRHDAYDTSTEAFVLRRALAKLPADYREPLILQIIAGYETSEIATLLNTTPNAITMRLFRARQRLRDMLGELQETAPPWRWPV